MFDWFKKLFVKKTKEPETVSVSFVLPDGKKFDVLALKLDVERYACPTHKDYVGIKPPTNNCNVCWEYHSQKRRWHK